MTTDQTMLFALLGVVFALLLWGRIRYDVVAFGALVVAVLLGVVEQKAAFAGFGHPAVIIIALVAWLIVRWTRSGQQAALQTPLEIAKTRYAKGEITREEFDQLKKDLS